MERHGIRRRNGFRGRTRLLAAGPGGHEGTFSGTPVESLNLNLSIGWSMIGGTNDDVQAAGVFPDFYQLVTWTGSGYVPATVFEPGKDYWAPSPS